MVLTNPLSKETFSLSGPLLSHLGVPSACSCFFRKVFSSPILVATLRKMREEKVEKNFWRVQGGHERDLEPPVLTAGCSECIWSGSMP
jgi:hypothetical protein